jgi:hypothetical protein
VSFIPPSPLKEPFSYQRAFFKNKVFEDTYHKNDIYRNYYTDVLDNHKNLIKYIKEQNFKGEVEKIEEMETNIFQSLFAVDYTLDKALGQKPGFVPKRKYWLVNGSNSIQFAQAYISENWYKGGVGNFNMQSYQNLTANYKKNKVTFNNLLEWRLSLYTNPNDTLRATRIGDNLLRLYSDFGVLAIKNWSYSANIDARTQLLRQYQENSTKRISSILSPLTVTVGLGMKYQKSKSFPKVKGKGLNFSAAISPLAIKYTYIDDKEVDPTRWGIEAGKNSYLDKLGSTITVNLTMNFNKYVSFISRFNYFTTYEKVVVESENTFNLPINRFFSTKIYIYGRFDDNKLLKKDPRFGRVQLNELLSFGFNYKW